MYDIPHNNQKTTVLVGMMENNTLIGPYFFRGTANAAYYLAMLDNQVIPELHWEGMGLSLEYGGLGMGFLLLQV